MDIKLKRIRFAWNTFIIGLSLILCIKFAVLVGQSYDIEDQQEAQQAKNIKKYGWAKP